MITYNTQYRNPNLLTLFNPCFKDMFSEDVILSKYDQLRYNRLGPALIGTMPMSDKAAE